MNSLISVIIPTYNRFKNLLLAIESVKNQTYKNIEIIVINDGSTQEEYYNYDWKKENIKFINLEKNSKLIFGFPCAGYVRNEGIKNSKGDYIAFLDDDDYFLPHKLELQINKLIESGLKMCSTDGLIGKGSYNKNCKYIKYNSECHFVTLKNKFNLVENKLPSIWTYDLIKKHNAIICSSVLIEKNILKKINYFENVINGSEDYNCWLKCLKHTNLIYIDKPCFYYDDNHGKD